jgi:hypothetical protein
MSECPDVPGAVMRPLVEPVPCTNGAIVHRGDATHPGLATLRAVAAEVATKEAWQSIPDGTWLPTRVTG